MYDLLDELEVLLIVGEPSLCCWITQFMLLDGKVITACCSVWWVCVDLIVVHETKMPLVLLIRPLQLQEAFGPPPLPRRLAQPGRHK